MPLPDLSSSAVAALEGAGSLVAGLFTPTLRIGVTGLSRAGKTVFITALVRSLTEGGRLPFLTAAAEGRLLTASLEPQPDDAVPRFDYEAHIEALSRDPPLWPESTRRISELRVSLLFKPRSTLARTLGAQRLNLDIVDYPGEWLIDLAMLDQDYRAWSAAAMAHARSPRRKGLSEAWLAHARSLDPKSMAAEPVAIEAARQFTSFLAACRASEGLATQGPGRFLMPGDLEGSPLLTFVPLDIEAEGAPVPNSLEAMMQRRYESYREHVVRPFFRDHFKSLDRQIVLVDVLGAVNGGPEAVDDLEVALAGVLKAFRPGRRSWLAALLGRRTVDRLLFAATKADHVHHTSYDRLEALLRLVTDRAIARAEAAGAEVKVMALAALRATREVKVTTGGEELACIAGIPLSGERIDGRLFDGHKEAVVFPGDLPADPEDALSRAGPGLAGATFVRFRPPRLATVNPAGETPPAPHIRLDKALEFLFGDRLT